MRLRRSRLVVLGAISSPFRALATSVAPPQMPPCGTDDIQKCYDYLSLQDGWAIPMLQTSMLITRCLEEKPLLQILFNLDGSTEQRFPSQGWQGLFVRFAARWRRWVLAGRPNPKDQNEIVLVLEVLRRVTGALQLFAETVYGMAMKLAVNQACALHDAVPETLEESVLRLAAGTDSEVGHALTLLGRFGSGALDGGVSRFWIPVLGAPTAIVQQHATIDVLPSMIEVYRNRRFPEKVFEVLYELTRTIGAAKCRLQAHLFGYIQVAMTEVAETCLAERGFDSVMEQAHFKNTFGGVLDVNGGCPEGLEGDNGEQPPRKSESQALPPAFSSRLPEYVFFPACCRRFHVLTELLKTLGADEGAVRVAELGVRRADTTEELLLRFPRLEILGVDPFHGDDPLFAWTTDRLAPYAPRARILRAESAEVARNLSMSFDLVFVDGDHGFAEVVQDVELWSPLVRPGGILAGHDAFNPVCDVHMALRYLKRTSFADEDKPIHIAADFVFFWYV